MTQVLSSEELQALLDLVTDEKPAAAPRARGTGRLQSRNARVYDWHSNAKFSPEEMRPFDTFLARAAAPVAAAFGAKVRAAKQATTHGAVVEQLGLRTFAETIADPSFIFRLSFPHGSPALLVLDPQLVALIVDRMLGGSGTGLPVAREPGRAVVALAPRVAEVFLEPLRAALRSLVPATLAVEAVETDPEKETRRYAPSESFASVEFKLDAAPFTGTMRIAFPFSALAPLLKRAAKNSRPTSGAAAKAAPARTLPKDAPIAGLPLSGTAVLGEAQLSVRELVALEPGDVLRLDRRADAPLELGFGGITRFQGKLGTHAGHLAIKIAATIRSDERSSA